MAQCPASSEDESAFYTLIRTVLIWLPRLKEDMMDTTTLLIIILLVLILFGGGFYGRGRWW